MVSKRKEKRLPMSSTPEAVLCFQLIVTATVLCLAKMRDAGHGFHHDTWVCCIRAIEVRCPTLQFQIHGDDGDQHEQHA